MREVEPNPNWSCINRFNVMFMKPEENPNRIFPNRKERTGTELNNVSRVFFTRVVLLFLSFVSLL